jgi:hypothetical protein
MKSEIDAFKENLLKKLKSIHENVRKYEYVQHPFKTNFYLYF